MWGPVGEGEGEGESIIGVVRAAELLGMEGRES